MSRQRPTGLLMGRFQPFHDGHRALALEVIERVGAVCFAVRDTVGIDDKNPFEFETIRARIFVQMADNADRITVIQVPNIVSVFYGRDVGYSIERLHLTPDLEAVSATKIRKDMTNG